MFLFILQRYEFYFMVSNIKATFLLKNKEKILFSCKYQSKCLILQSHSLQNRVLTKLLSIMFEFSINIIKTAKNYNLQERDVILCHLLAAGIDRSDAYYVLYNRGKNLNSCTRTTQDAAAADFIHNNPAINILVQKIKARKPVNTVGTQNEVRQAVMTDKGREESEEVAELKTREGLIKRFSRELSVVHGKDSVQGLIQLAKLEGYDKEDTRTEEERRKYFLPWRTKCRGCKLMQLYTELEDQTQGEAPEEAPKTE